jgi:hypothetical protein
VFYSAVVNRLSLFANVKIKYRTELLIHIVLIGTDVSGGRARRVRACEGWQTHVPTARVDRRDERPAYESPLCTPQGRSPGVYVRLSAAMLYLGGLDAKDGTAEINPWVQKYRRSRLREVPSWSVECSASRSSSQQ